MARAPRVDFPGAIHHVTSRGDRRETIFVDTADRQRLLGRLALVIGRFGLSCHAYCLMTNHYHLLIETPNGGLPPAMQQLNGWYTQTFNRRHRTVGHVFQGRYHATLIEDGAHLLEVARYIVLNPIRAGICTEPSAWPWSSYRATAGLESTPSVVRTDSILGQFGANRRAAIEAYVAFVNDEPRSREGGLTAAA